MSLRVCFFHSDKPRERILADAFAAGARQAGDLVELRRLTPEIALADADVAVMVGVKSRQLFRAHWDAGQHVVMIDKGYTRHAAAGPVKLWEYWRVAVDGHHPTQKLMAIERPHDRAEKLGLKMHAWRVHGRSVVIAGSSAKYHEFYGLRDPTTWTGKAVRLMRNFTLRPIIYRPKPSWREAVTIDGTVWSGAEESIDQALAGAWCMVTHGSNACFEAVLAGIPVITLGDAVAAPLSSHDVHDIEDPRLAAMGTRLQWLANLAYCQWTMQEFASGEAWATIRPQIRG